MSAPPTILTQKLSFLTSQSQLLSTVPHPSRQWQRDNAGSQLLPQRAVDEALSRLAAEVKQHGRRMYAPQVMRNVAEQIEELYLRDAERKTEGIGGDGVGTEVDLAADETITKLPQTWPSDREATAHPAEAKRYADLQADLTRLAAERAAVRERVERLRRMGHLLTPFEAGDDEGRGGVQENLVTRDGDVEKALERMRMLLVRVGGRLAALEQDGEAMHEDEEGERTTARDDVQASVDRILENLRK